MSRRERYVVGLDVGTSNVCAVVGESLDDGSLDIVGIGTADIDDFPQPAFYLKAFRVGGATKDEVVVARDHVVVEALHQGLDGRPGHVGEAADQRADERRRQQRDADLRAGQGLTDA